LRAFLPPPADIPSGRIRQITQTGREGWIAAQE
jgi:hypothetical protein